MSEANIQRLRLAAAAANKRDPSILDELLAPGIFFQTQNTAIDLVGSYQGIDEVKTFFARWDQAWEDWDWDYRDMRAIGDTVLARLHLWVRGRNSGIESESDIWQLWTFRNGKVIYYEDFESEQQALEAAGLSE